MCIHKILANCKHGYIVRCTKCNHFQIGFGTTVFTLTEKQYEKFKQQANEQLSIHENDDCQYRKTIQLSTFSKNVLFVVSLTEVRQLTEIIQEADLMLEVENILSEKIKQN